MQVGTIRSFDLQDRGRQKPRFGVFLLDILITGWEECVQRVALTNGYGGMIHVRRIHTGKLVSLIMLLVMRTVLWQFLAFYLHGTTAHASGSIRSYVN